MTRQCYPVILGVGLDCDASMASIGVFSTGVRSQCPQGENPEFTAAVNCLNWYALGVYEWSSTVEELDESIEAVRRQLARVTRFPEDFKKVSRSGCELRRFNIEKMSSTVAALTGSNESGDLP